MRIVLLFIIAGLVSLFTVQNSFGQSKIKITHVVKKSYNGSDISCKGVNDGEITVTASGGSAIMNTLKITETPTSPVMF